MFRYECHWQYGSMRLMYVVVATYTHGSHNLDVYIEVVERFNIMNPKVNRNMYVRNF